MFAASVIIGYLLGSIPFALLLARRWGGRDLRRLGSGNVGAANVLRASGVMPAVLVALLDAAKGAAGVLLAERLHSSAGAPAAAGLAAVVGHVYPVWLRFRGGKGVATACGAFSVLAPAAMLPSLVAFLAGAWTTRYVSVGSLVASIVLPTTAYMTDSPRPIVLAALVAAALILFRHRSNVGRLRAGTERRIGVRA
jgi:glycerol-3-phosphate acyltransferase PlsY